MLARQQIRRRWISTVGLTLLIGIIGAIVLAAVAGARRTSTAFTRFTTTSHAATLEVLPPFAYIPTAAQLNAVRRVCDVESVAELRSYAVFVQGAPLTFGVASQMD